MEENGSPNKISWQITRVHVVIFLFLIVALAAFVYALTNMTASEKQIHEQQIQIQQLQEELLMKNDSLERAIRELKASREILKKNKEVRHDRPAKTVKKRKK